MRQDGETDSASFFVPADLARVFRACSAVGKTPNKTGARRQAGGGKNGKGAGPVGPAPLPPLPALYVGQQGPLVYMTAYEGSEFLQFPYAFGALPANGLCAPPVS